MLILKKINKFVREMGGAIQMDKMPDALFVVDAVSDNIAVREANKMGVKVIGLCDTNADPTWFDYPVAANDDGIKSIKIVCEAIIRAYAQGKKEAGLKIGEKEVSKVSKESKESEVATEKEDGLDEILAEEAAVIEEEVEKKVVDESSRKVE